MALAKLLLKDSFKEWLAKINLAMGTIDNIIENPEGSSVFAYDSSFTQGRTVRFLGGKVRAGSLVADVPQATFALEANTVYIIAIEYKASGPTFTLKAYKSTEVPVEEVIPVGSITTNATAVSQYVDLRTQYSFRDRSQDAELNSDVMFFDKSITRDVVIPTNKNAVSVSPVVENGNTVVVSEGSVWVVL